MEDYIYQGGILMKRRILFVLIFAMLLIPGCMKDNVDNKELAITVGGEDRTIIERSELISDIVVELYGIDDATTVIFNDTALIGVKIAYDQKLTSEMKSTISNMVKEKDILISEVKVSQNNKIYSQIDSIITQLLNGSSYDSLVNQVSKLKDKIK